MKGYIILFFCIFYIPLATALDCNDFAETELCEEILDSDITEEEQYYLLSGILTDSTYYPDHDFVYNWNDDIDLATAPNDVTTTNSSYITNAWVDILAIMPSVQYDDILYIDTEGEILTAYAHSINLPNGREDGDCRTDYSMQGHSATTSVYINGNYVNVGNNVVYTVQLDDLEAVSIDAYYDISVNVKVKHYKYDHHGYCVHDDTEYRSNSLQLHDNVEAVVHDPDLDATLNIVDQYYDTTNAQLEHSDYVNMEVGFDTSSLQQHNYVFSEEITHEPLGVLVVHAQEYESTVLDNLVYTDNELIYPTSEDCSITLSTFFDTESFVCDTTYTDFEFNVTTDKLTYNENETILVTVEPVGNYIVTYAEQEYEIVDDLEIEAVSGQTRITVQNGNNVITEYIHVNDSPSFSFMVALSFFGMLNYGFMIVAKRLWGVVE
jgi:hypothetical protein